MFGWETRAGEIPFFLKEGPGGGKYLRQRDQKGEDILGGISGMLQTCLLPPPTQKLPFKRKVDLGFQERRIGKRGSVQHTASPFRSVPRESILSRSADQIANLEF